MNMLQSVKRFWWVLLLVAGVPAARGFSLLGPIIGGDAWQVNTIDYDVGESFSDFGGPKNIGEEYRRNTPVMYYAYDANFLEFFGSNGVAAVDSAFAMMNAAFTNSPTGSHLRGGWLQCRPFMSFPSIAKSVNYTAQSLGLTDLKSIVLGCLVEQMALADPVRYVWTLRSRTAGTRLSRGDDLPVSFKEILTPSPRR